MVETVDEVKLHKVVDEMLRQRCTSGDEHQYHIDQMQNFLKNDIMTPEIGLLWLLSVFITSIVIWERVHDFQLAWLCDPSLSKEDAEYMQLSEEEIEERLKHRDQIRRWEMYVNGRPFASRREHLV
ncbi:hypothetical protein Tco_1311612 [Tanacetum coccineum]